MKASLLVLIIALACSGCRSGESDSGEAIKVDRALLEVLDVDSSDYVESRSKAFCEDLIDVELVKTTSGLPELTFEYLATGESQLTCRWKAGPSSDLEVTYQVQWDEERFTSEEQDSRDDPDNGGGAFANRPGVGFAVLGDPGVRFSDLEALESAVKRTVDRLPASLD